MGSIVNRLLLAGCNNLNWWQLAYHPREPRVFAHAIAESSEMGAFVEVQNVMYSVSSLGWSSTGELRTSNTATLPCKSKPGMCKNATVIYIRRCVNLPLEEINDNCIDFCAQLYLLLLLAYEREKELARKHHRLLMD